jgi:hypothetical protein
MSENQKINKTRKRRLNHQVHQGHQERLKPEILKNVINSIFVLPFLVNLVSLVVENSGPEKVNP